MIDEQYKARKEIVEQNLTRQAAKLPLLISDKYQLKDFFEEFFTKKNLLQASPDYISKLINRIEKLYPGGFKWIFWDKNAKIIPINSKNILEGRKSWETLFSSLMKSFNILGNAAAFSKTDHFKHKIGYSLQVLQKALGEDTKVEHLHGARETPIEAEWFGKKCLIFWGLDVVSYAYENVPKEIRGGGLVMAFKDALGEYFWLNRLLKRRKRISNLVPYPLMLIDLSERKLLRSDEELADKISGKAIIDAYINRKNSIFEFDHYMVKASLPDNDSKLRIFSIADLSKPMVQRNDMLNALYISTALLVLVSLIVSLLLPRFYSRNISLRKRIALLFLIAVCLPVLSLMSIGKTFLTHEEKRLMDTAYQQMEEGLEALELRYRDAPRLRENFVYNEIKKLIGSDTSNLSHVKTALDKAVARGLMANYIVGDINGNFLLDNWKDIHLTIKNALKITMKKMLEVDKEMKHASKSVLKDAIDEEMESLLSSFNFGLDLSRPSHLRYYCFQDFHMYFMSSTLNINGIPHSLIIHVPDYYIERSFVRSEFSKNVLATQNSGKNGELKSELFFYSRFKADSHLPEHCELWTMLEKDFNRSFELKVKETGKIKIGDESFLYCIMPLKTMYSQSYIPCLLTSTKQIDSEIYKLKIFIFSLAAFAALGAVLLSLVLAGSLLGPISCIDSAAQKIGKGDLTVSLPDMGADEIGRLSKTFNEMVKGLRERERMQAYVSDSVLEAVQDHADRSISKGKHIEATILFSDIRNFTGLTEQHKPEEIFSLLNEFLGGVEEIIRANKGRVDKFIGDAVMAVFHDATGENHALSAVKAAVEMQKFVKKLNKSRQKTNMFSIKIGIGISTGTVLLGDVGSSRRKDLTVIGDEVNLAARLEAASKEGKHSRIILSGATYEVVKNKVEVAEMPINEVRGKKRAVKIYELVKLLQT
ncbi:MAG: hypothetical protein Kow0029_01010 [Candidatus Rifleibacteriota bacterium]